ncbi:3650_t:CDS:10 [Paraglomus brasilianum]|uniref:3650_t:CDS:1 n=1 Tax=Paraglomus brasilianum TaxID=144538 RepID=A0A9N9ADC0_9GLOM|nr:3650_t:CDS:10 [Paraglomus brasilianum]
MSTVGNRIVLKASLRTGNGIVSRRIPVRYTPDLTFDEVYSLLSEVYEIEHFVIYYADEGNDRIHVKSDGELRDVIARLKETNGAENKLVIKLQLEKILKPEPVSSVANNTPVDPVLTPVSYSSASNDTASNTDCDNVDDDHPFERVINHVMKNVQDIIQNIVQPISELSDNSEDQQEEQQTNDVATSSESEFPQHSSTSSIPSSITETQEVAQPPPYCSIPPRIPSLSSPRPPRYSVRVAVHHGIKCDVCNETIRGMRWKCKNCRDYDLCQQCKSNPPSVGFHPATHEFQSIPYPLHNVRTTQSVNMHSAICDFCESVVLGTRHKCINCPDFDLCSNCVALAPTQHPNHTFMQIQRPGEPEIKILDSAQHPGIKCDHCNKQITGLRYKCGNCSDFDLCGNCEASPLNDHDKTHVFLKIRRPTPNPIISHKPLLPNLYVVQEPTSYKGRYGCYSRCYYPKSSSTCNVSLASSQINQPATNLTNSNEPVVPNSTPSSVKSGSSTSKAPIALYDTKETHYNPIEPLWHASVPRSANLDSQSSEQEVREPSSGSYKSRFLGDVNVPDKTVMVPQAQFVKIWRLQNDGTVAWPESTMLQFLDGHTMFNKSLKAGDDKFRPKFHVGAVEPGQTCEVSADLQAPAEPGEYVSYWRLVDGEGNRFGYRVWCEINVEAIDQYSSLSSSSMIFPVLDNPVSDISSSRSSMTSVDTGLHTSDVENTEDSDADSTEIESQCGFDATGVEDSLDLLYDSRYYTTCVDSDNDEFVFVDDSDDEEEMGASQVLSQGSSADVELQDNATRDENSKFANELRKLKELGFTDREKNIRLLELHGGNLKQVEELLFLI